MKRNVKRHAVTQPLDQSIKFIALTKGQFMRVSAHRYDEFMEHPWFANWDDCTGGFYAMRNSLPINGRRHHIIAHRQILGLEYGDPREGDHKNRDTLDNTDDNLRIVTPEEQARNQGIRRDNTSGHKGVSYFWQTGRWRAYIFVKGKQINLGYYLTREEAITAYRTAALLYYGTFATFI